MHMPFLWCHPKWTISFNELNYHTGENFQISIDIHVQCVQYGFINITDKMAVQNGGGIEETLTMRTNTLDEVQHKSVRYH